ncbi:MAG: hypothetical protein AB7E47_12145 [Desulfovibrionaceae bacterium]
MSNLDDFVHGLATETMVEMADNFFGTRKSVDDECDLFAAMAKNVAAQGEAALQKACLLHALLLDGEAAGGFYKAIGVVPRRLFAWVKPENASLFLPMPRGLTAKSRYIKLVRATYAAVQQAMDIYMNGRYQEDPRQPGRKRLSIHYHLLKDWSGDINRTIRNVNEGQAPSCVLGFARDMDVRGASFHNLVGGTLNDLACSLDDSLKLPLVNCEDYGLREFPALPPEPDVRKAIKAYTGKLYNRYPRFVCHILRRLSLGV